MDQQQRIRVSVAGGAVSVTSLVITAWSLPDFVVNLSSVSLAAGTNHTLSATVLTRPLTYYQWQYKDDPSPADWDSVSWNDLTAEGGEVPQGGVLSLNVTQQSPSVRRYRIVLSTQAGGTHYSTTAQVTYV